MKWKGNIDLENRKVSLGNIDLNEQASAPASAAGIGKVYTKTDGNLYFLDSSGTEVQLGVSGAIDGSGAANQITFWSDADTLTSSADLTWDGATFTIEDDTAGFPQIGFVGHGNGASPPTQFFRKSRGTKASPTAIVDTDKLGCIYFQGYDGSAYQNWGIIHCTVNDASPDANTNVLLEFTLNDGTANRKLVEFDSSALTFNFDSTDTDFVINGTGGERYKYDAGNDRHTWNVGSTSLDYYNVSGNSVLDMRGSGTINSSELILGDSVTWNNIKWTTTDLLEVGSSSPFSIANAVDTALTATSAEGSLQVLGGAYITKNLNVQGNAGVTGTFQFYTSGAATGVFVSDILDEDNMVSDSATALATQQSIKAYVDANSGGTSTTLTSQTVDGGVATGDPVYLDATSWKEALKTTKRPTGLYAGTSGEVVVSGEATGLSGLTAGSDYFLAAAGGLTTNSSETGIFIGTALSTTSLNVDIDDGYEELDDDNIPSPTVIEIAHPDNGLQAFNFTRGSTATYIGEDGLIKTAAVNEVRKEFDPITRRENGWLIEEGRTNICLQSEDFSTTWSTLAASVTTNTTTAPDGNTTADKIVEDGTTNIHRVGQGGMTITNAANDRYAVSVFAKLADAGRPVLRIETGGTSLPADASYFNVSTGTVGTKGAGHENSYMEPLPDGWYRCVVIVDPIGAASDGNIFFYGAPSETNSWAGDGTSGMYMWGADVEQCNTTREASSYIPTTTAAVARVGDVPSLHRDVAKLNETEGTFYIEGRIKHNNVTAVSNRTPVSMSIYGDASNVYWLLYWENSDRIINITRRATVQTVGLTGIGPVLASDDKFATALSYDLNAGGTDNHRITTDGYTAGLASVANPSGPVLVGSEYIWLGNLSGVTEWMNGYITKFLYFPSNMSAAQIQRATQTRNG